MKYKKSIFILFSLILVFNISKKIYAVNLFNESWISIYEKLILEHYNEQNGNTQFILYDLDEDGVPELFLGFPGMSGYFKIYTIKNNNELKLLNNIGSTYNFSGLLINQFM